MYEELDIEKICRVCLRDKELVPIFQECDQGKSIAKIVNECNINKIERFDGLPQHICMDCKNSAVSALQFKRQCEKSYRHLINTLQITAKSSQNHVETQTEGGFLQPCEFCDKTFFNDLKIHQEQDHKGSDIKCRYCEKSFNRIGKLRTHLAVLHPETGFEPENQCSICARQFMRREHLQRHLEYVHKIVEKDVGYEFQSCKQEVDNLLENEEELQCIEKVNLKIGAENNFIDHIENEDEENLLLYIKQFDNISDEEEDNKPLALLQQSEQSNSGLAEILLDCETAQINNKDVDMLNENQISDIILFKNEETKNIRKQNKLKQFPCDQCEKIFTRKSHLERHQATRHKETNHFCHICEKKFKTLTYLQRHVANHAKKRYVCKECNQNYQTKAELNSHVKSEGHDKLLLCPECGLRCRTSNILTVHLRRHKGEKPFKCKFCSKGFPRSDDLKLHEKYHTGEKSHFCSTCGKGFQRKYNLTIHLRVHTGEKPYKCPHCPQAFAQCNDLKAHIRRHTGERFRCEICDAGFLQGYQIRQHKLNEHGIRDEPPTQRVAKFTSLEAQKEQIQQNMKKDLIQV